MPRGRGLVLGAFVLLAIAFLTAGCGTADAPDSAASSRNQKRSAGGTGEPSGPLLLSAAASLHEVVSEATAAFTARHPKVEIRSNLGSSGQLASQIEGGAPVDLFLSASTRDADRVLAPSPPNDPVASDRRTLAANTLVIVTGAEAGSAVADRPESLLEKRFDRIALGNPATVPAGRYAEQSLRALGLWDRLQPRLVFGEDVRQVVEYVVRGECPAGIVYATDARQFAERLRAGPAFPDSSHDPILYEGVVPPASTNPHAARAFLGFLASGDGRAIFVSHGFAPPPQE